MDILIVDDEPDILEAFKMFWKDKEDVSIRTALNGREALQQMEQRIPDVMVTDYRMPNMSGMELIRRTKEKHPDMYIVMMTAFSDPELRDRSYDAGGDAFIAKPFNPVRLLQDIRDAL